VSARRPTRATLDGRVYLDLRNAARQSDRDTGELLALYALECFLARLAASPFASDLVLKGGVLLAAFAARRPTRDIDLSASGFDGDVEEVVRRAREIARIERADGMTFDLDSVVGGTIREGDSYAGVRVTMTAGLFTARIPFHLDVNFGDPLWPAPSRVRMPLLLGGELELDGYPLHMVLAEKITTAVDRGTANTRWRDFVDIDAITARNEVSGSDLTTAMALVARHRQVTIAPLSVVLEGMATLAQPRWSVWRRKQRLEQSTPPDFQDLLVRCLDFADPVLRGEAAACVWKPRRWEPSNG
jgi:hypothetical protein